MLPYSVVCPSARMSSVTLVHPKAAGWNEMPFSRDTRVFQSNNVLNRGPGPPRKGNIWEVGTSSSQRRRLLLNYFGPSLLRYALTQ